MITEKDFQYWFKPKQFWKWFACYYPVSRRGWGVTLALVGTGGLLFVWIDLHTSSLLNTFINFLPWGIVLLVIFDVLCLRKGEYPNWWRPRRNLYRRLRTQILMAHKLLDPWSMPHFLFGMVMALFAIVFSLSPLFIFTVMLSLAIFWEFFELSVRLPEAPGNGLVDIALSLIAFGITIALVDRSDPNPQHHVALFVVALLVYLTVNFFAWRARFEQDEDFQG
ncbi:MAG: hypothetical protein ACSLEX_01525 [Minisyncoccota bacterium]